MTEQGGAETGGQRGTPEQANHNQDANHGWPVGDALSRWLKEQDEQWEREQRDLDEDAARNIYGDHSVDPEMDVSSYYAHLLPEGAPLPPDILGLNPKTKAGEEAQARYNEYARNYFSKKRRPTNQSPDYQPPKEPLIGPDPQMPSEPTSSGHRPPE